MSDSDGELVTLLKKGKLKHQAYVLPLYSSELDIVLLLKKASQYCRHFITGMRLL